MSIELANVFVPPPVAVPRFAQWLARAMPLLREGACRASHVGHKVWSALEAYGQARANRELQRLAAQHRFHPELAQALRGAMRPERGA
jgi:hypothetical protein